MAKFAVIGGYTAEAWSKMIDNPGDRVAAVQKVAQAAGGKLEQFFWSFGDDDYLAIIDAPDDISAAAVSIAVGSSGSLRNLRTIRLITPEEGRQVLELTRPLPACLCILLVALGLPRFAVPAVAAGLPDLATISFTGPTSTVIDRSFEVSWTVKNQGDASIVSGGTIAFTDTVYLSTSPTLDASALPIGHRVHSGTRLSPYELPAGASYTETLVVGGHGMPPIATGLHYLFLKTDSTDAVAEADETNNVAGPVSFTLAGANLVATSITAPPNGTAETPIPLTRTVENQGDAD